MSADKPATLKLSYSVVSTKKLKNYLSGPHLDSDVIGLGTGAYMSLPGDSNIQPMLRGLALLLE